jgi:protein-tyrosine-phosphatase
MDTGTRSTSPIVIAFVCLHGSAKSLIASEYLNRVAARRISPPRTVSSHLVASCPMPRSTRGRSSNGPTAPP